jgi:hypothetical protein
MLSPNNFLSIESLQTQTAVWLSLGVLTQVVKND